MIFGKSRLELKVGSFVFIGFLILTVFILRIGDFKILTSGTRINFLFNFANGVKIGAPIRFAGVDVGEVKEIHLIYAPEESKTKVQISGWIKRGLKIPLDSAVWVNTLGLLGEKYIEVIPGKNYASFLAPDGTLIGNDPIAMHEVTQLVKTMADDIEECIVRIKNREGTVGRLLYDDTIYKELEALIMDIRKHPWKLFLKTKEKKTSN